MPRRQSGGLIVHKRFFALQHLAHQILLNIDPAGIRADEIPERLLVRRGLQSPWILVVMDQYTRRTIGFSVHTGNIDDPSLCRMFDSATSGQGWPERISSDNDPLFQYHRWKYNIRVLDTEEIKSVQHVPMSHPFVERLTGSVRRELLDHTFFWAATDLENKLRHYQDYYNEHRCHLSRDCKTPIESGGNKIVDISSYRWQTHCRRLFQLPISA